MIFLWLAFGLVFIWGAAVSWKTNCGANDFPGTEAGLAGCGMMFLWAGVSWVLLSWACCLTFEGWTRALSPIMGFVFILGTLYLFMHFVRLDYEKKHAKKQAERQRRDDEWKRNNPS